MSLPELSNLFIGTIISSNSLEVLNFFPCGLLGVLKSGKIAFCFELILEGLSAEKAHEKKVTVLAELASSYSFNESVVKYLSEHQFLIPGYLDTHIHSPQYVFAGTGYDLPLLGWLEKHTFPRESEFSDLVYAQDAYERVVSRTLRSGTTTACYYATIHLDACKVLAEVVLEIGQRAFLGKINQSETLKYLVLKLVDKYEDIIILSKQEFVEFVIARDKEFKLLEPTRYETSALITPCITPRFAPSCTSKLMTSLGIIAASYNLPIQTHLSESKAEIEWVHNLHPQADPETLEWTYTGVYHSHGLLTDRSVLAHCIHLTSSERRLIKKVGAGISHCPASNFQLQSGVLNVRRLLNEGINVGLGTDMAGGHAPSIVEAMRLALLASKTAFMLFRDGLGGWGEELEGECKEPLTLAEVFYLATLGGAKVLGLDKLLGNFEAGKEFDALVIDLNSTGASIADSPEKNSLPGTFTVDVFPHDDKWSMFEKYIYLGDDRNVKEVYVAGRKVVPLEK
ncbi:hypothetical protein HK096_003569 [Nowakowskiella sp. JEL0078]|nr:hypothetical protein HK096_003569 [Nowakowskiella sp. JEL0078]